MSDSIGQLETRVQRAAERIGTLSAENQRLAQETRNLRDRVEQLEREAAAHRSGGSAPVWQAQRDHAVALLSETLSELRGE